MTYEAILEWARGNFNFSDYWTAEDLIRDVENHFGQDGRNFPAEARELIRNGFENRDYYRRLEEKQLAADMLGNGTILTGLSDEIIADMEKPEIMGVDISNIATTREEVLPPEVRVFQKQTFFRKITSSFKNLFFGRLRR